MAETLHIREGTTETISMQLFGDKAPINLTGVNKVALVLIPANGTGTAASIDTTTNPTKLAITGATIGRVAWTPASGDVTKANSPYKAFFWVYSTASIKYSVPADEEFVVEVTDDFS